MNFEDLSIKELENISNMINHLKTERAKQSGEKNYGSYDAMTSQELSSREQEIKTRIYDDAKKTVYSEYGSFDKMTDNELSSLGNMVSHLINERAKQGGFNHYGTTDNMTSGELDAQASEIKARQYADAAKSTYSEYGSYDKMSDNEIKSLESMISNNRREYAVSGGNDSSIRGNIESAEDISHLEAAVKQQKKDDAWAIEYFKELNKNPKIIDMTEFKAAVSRSIQSNRIINKFFDEYTDALGTKLYELKKTDPTQTDVVTVCKEAIENYLNVYSTFMFELKMQEASIDYQALQIPDYIKESIWDQQRKFGITFAMPIPARYNDRAPLELLGDAVSVINTMNGYTKGYHGQILGEKEQEQEMDK